MKHMTIVLLMFPFCLTRAGTTFQEQAARLQDINAYLLDFRPGTAPIRPDKGRIELALDGSPQPGINTRVGNKEEPVDPPSFVPRFRARYLWSNGLMVGGTVTPGIEFQDYEADYFAVELGYRFYLWRHHFALRAHYTDGDVTGPITEQNVEDFFTFTNQGLDFSAGRAYKSFHFYVFAGYTEAETSLDVASDGVRLDNESDAFYAGLGVTWRFGHRFTANFEQNFTDDYLQHMILSLGYRF